MEYERIHKVQTGIISPSKLRIKLLGPHRKKDGSNSNSSRTSPSKLVDSESVNSLLASKSRDFDDEVTGPSLEVPSMERSNDVVKLNNDTGRLDGVNQSAVHPMRMLEDENLDYDSNASSSSFEFDKGERSVQSVLSRSSSRHVPSKWNDAEKWIMNKQNMIANHSKKSPLHNSVARLPSANMVRIAPDCASLDQKSSVTRIGLEKFSFAEIKDLEQADQRDIACTETPKEDRRGALAIRSVCMRDMGTEMTPATSLEPSRTATPVGATTPLLSPTSSIPSTPRRGAPAQTHEESLHHVEANKKELSEEEMKLRTRKEIMALGIQLGKMNIAAWASKDDFQKNRSLAEAAAKEELERIEIEKQAASWEEAEKSRYTTRFKREEIKIHAWESQQKVKLDAEMRKIEAQVEEMRARARAKMVKRMAMARQRSEEKRATAEARKSRDAERTKAQAECIRETGRVPSTSYICCGWLS